jgi:PAS domain S-box-containing protein
VRKTGKTGFGVLNPRGLPCTDGQGNNSLGIIHNDIPPGKNVYSMEEGIKVLYVDDEPDLLEIARLFLEQTGNFQVFTSTSAQGALGSTLIPSYDAIVADYQMPGMDGIAFLKEVRSRYGDIPFILFTGRGREEVVIEAINHGADFYLQKGGDPTAQFAELGHKIRQAVLRKRSDLSRVKAECSLRESEELLRLFIGHAPVALAMFDKEMRYIAASRRWMADYHLGDRDLRGCSHYEIFPEIPEELKDVHSRSLAGEIVSADAEKFERQDGSIQWISWEVRPWYTATGEIGGIIIFSEDVTQRNTAEHALQALIRSMVGTTGVYSLKMITENVSSWLNADCVMVGEINPDEKTVRVLSMLLDGKEVNDYTYTLKGTPCDDVAGKGFCLYPDNAARLFPESRDLVELNIRGYLGTPLKNHGGRVIGILCALFRDPVKPIPSLQETLDIIAVKAAAEIERSQIERELRKNEYFLSEAMDMANMADWEFDASTGIFTFNDRFYTLYGTTAGREGGYRMPAEVYAREFTHPDDQPVVGEEIEKALSTPESGYFSLREHRIIRRDGEIRWIAVRIRVNKDAQGRTIKSHGANQDITERKRAEEALRQANRKLTLLSGITRHDIKNQILTLDGFIALLHRKIPGPAYDNYFSRISTASSQIAKLIQFTREYEQLGTTGAVWQDIGKIAKMAAADLLPETVHLSVDAEHCEIFADPMFMMVLYNFFDNALRHGDHVTGITIRLEDEGTQGILIVEDNGIGVPADLKEQIFERGFGKNTGLGLFLIREILSITGATIRETGTEGKGVRFEIFLSPGTWRRNTGKADERGVC